MSIERFERLAELARRVEQIDAEWRLLDARRRDRSPQLVQLRSLYDWVQDKERDFSERFPEVAATTALPEAPDPDDLTGETADARAWASLSARRSLLEDEWVRILAGWESLATEWQQLLERRRSGVEAVDAGLGAVRDQLLARERAISCAIAGVFKGAVEGPRTSTDPLFSSPTDRVGTPGPVVAAVPAAVGEAPASSLPGPSSDEASLRGAPRVSLGVPINLRVQHRLLQADTENVSLTGVFVRTDAPLPVGREVDLVFDLPERKGLQARGTVTWLRPAGVGGGAGAGVRFLELPEDTRRALETFVRRTGRVVRGEGTW
jgi:uncharacterized protein (TIGR02266 family)